MANKKRRILFFGEDLTLAHVTRPMVLANALDRDEYEVFFATGKQYLGFINKSIDNLIEIPTLSSDLFLQRLAKGQPIYTHDEIQSSVKKDLELLDELKPDLVVGDFRLSLGISSRVAGVPYACLTNAFWSEFSTLPFPVPDLPFVKMIGVKAAGFVTKIALPLVFKGHARPFNRVCQTHRVPGFRNLKDVYTHGDWTLYLDTPLLAPTQDKPDNHIYLGPLIWSPDDPLPNWWESLPEDRPVVYVTVGSSGDTRVVDTVLNALATLKVTVIVSSAGRFNGEENTPHRFVEKFLPGLDAAKRAALVICSGGTATTYQALSCGTPVIGIPCNADQYLCMEAVQKLGAGLLIRSGNIKAMDVKKAIETILKDSTYSQMADRVKKEIQAFHAPERFDSFISSIGF